ncbi:Mth938-like domain-containing protein [Desulfovulcanus sp.]
MIEKYSFGQIVVDGKRYTTDLKIIKGQVVPNWYRKKGHLVFLEDIEDIIQAKPRIIIIGKGKPGLLRVDDSLKKFLEKQGISLIEQKTAQAVLTFNELYLEKEPVAAGFHLTC